MIIEKDIARVSVGSYVVSISKQRADLKIRHRGWVRSLHSIETMIDNGVERVLIDTGKTLDEEETVLIDKLDANPFRSLKPDSKHSKPAKTLKQNSTRSTDRSEASFSPNLVVQAQKCFAAAVVCQKMVMKSARHNHPIDYGQVEMITHQIQNFVCNNPDALIWAINIRDPEYYLYEHSCAVSILMGIFANHLKIEKAVVRQLIIGGFLQDVGKVKIKHSILEKSSSLTAEEYAAVKEHVKESIDIVENIKEISSVSLDLVKCHHEKMDASGYPEGKTAEEISTYARMIAICDVYDALTNEKVYKKSLPEIRAFAVLFGMAEKQLLDFDLVSQFIKCLGVYPMASAVRLNTNQLAIVEKRNEKFPTLPVVKSFYSIKQALFFSPREIDLSKDKNYFVVKGVNVTDFDLQRDKILEYLLSEY